MIESRYLFVGSVWKHRGNEKLDFSKTRKPQLSMAEWEGDINLSKNSLWIRQTESYSTVALDHPLQPRKCSPAKLSLLWLVNHLGHCWSIWCSQLSWHWWWHWAAQSISNYHWLPFMHRLGLDNKKAQVSKLALMHIQWILSISSHTNTHTQAHMSEWIFL